MSLTALNFICMLFYLQILISSPDFPPLTPDSHIQPPDESPFGYLNSN